MADPTTILRTADQILARIARGMKRYVIEAERPFLVNVANSKTTGRGPNVWNVDEPARTITTSNGFALVSPSITRFNGGATGQDMRAPMPTVTANSWIKKPGGAAPLGLLAPVLTYAQHGGAVRDMADPMHTITASRKDQNAVILPHLLSLKGTTRRELPVNAPHPTVLAGSGHSALIAPHIMTMRNSQKPFNGADEPAHTITAGGAGLTTVIASIVGCGGRASQSRARGMNEPTATITSKADACVAAAFLAQHNGGPRMGQHSGHDLRDPMSTIAATGSQQMPVAAWFAKYYGTGDGAQMDEPLHTVTTKDRMGHMQAALQAPPFLPEHEARARAVADFLRAHDAWTGGEFVTLTIDGTTFVVVDIGMRMLTPRELFNAQGFPPDYQIDGHWLEADGDWHWKPFPKDVQVSCCGNSVCPDLARALVSANCTHLIEQRHAA